MKKIIRYTSLLLLIICVVGCSCSRKQIKDTTTVNVIPNKLVSNFIKYNDEIYYWKLNANSRIDQDLYGNYEEMQGFSTDLVKINKNGEEVVVLHAIGTGKIAIVNNKLYFNSIANTQGVHYISRIDLSTNETKTIGMGTFQYVSDGKLYGYIENYSKKGIFSIDCANDKYSEINKDNYLITVNDNYIIYSDYSNPDKLVIKYLKGSEDKKIMTINTSDFKGEVTGLSVEKADVNNNRIDLYVGYRDGSGASLQELIKYSSNLDGSKLKKAIVNYETEDISNEVVRIENNNIIYNINDDKNNIISIDELYDNYGLTKGDEYMVNIYQSSIIDDDIYFIIDYSSNDYDYNSGKNQYFSRIKTIYFRYNINSKKLENFYEF